MSGPGVPARRVARMRNIARRPKRGIFAKEGRRRVAPAAGGAPALNAANAGSA